MFAKCGSNFTGTEERSALKKKSVATLTTKPEILSCNGSYLAYLRMEEHVGRFREFLRQHGETRDDQELVAAKMMGRWRSGAPLVLSPDRDDPDPPTEFEIAKPGSGGAQCVSRVRTSLNAATSA